MATVEKVVFESKWGFHPVSRDVCLKLKKAQKLLLRAYRDIRKRARWEAKLNPQTPKPPMPEKLAEIGGYYKNGGLHLGLCMVSDKYYTSHYHQILNIYQIARRPVVSPIAVQRVYIPNYLDDTIAYLEDYYK